jgi:hypothetical protein
VCVCVFCVCYVCVCVCVLCCCRKVTHVVCENLSGSKAHKVLSAVSSQHYVRPEWITDSIQRGLFHNFLTASASAHHSVCILCHSADVFELPLCVVRVCTSAVLFQEKGCGRTNT